MKAFYTNIVLAIPHSVHRPEDINWLSDEAVAEEAYRWTDFCTDKIFRVFYPGLNVSTVLGEMSRFDCDCERLEGEDERICRFARCAKDAKFSQARVSASKWNLRLAEWFRYRYRLMVEVARGERPLIIDCHSFPADLAPDVDIDIGFNEDVSRPSDDVLAIVSNVFESGEWRVAFNKPYANAIAPVDYRGHSLMIEVNKHCYIDKDGRYLRDEIKRLNAAIEEICRRLLNKPMSMDEVANRYAGCVAE